MTELASRKAYDVVVAEDELLIQENLIKKISPLPSFYHKRNPLKMEKAH